MTAGARPRPLETATLTALALISFAFNSILTRMALRGSLVGQADAANFVAVRLLTGALMLALVVRVRAGAWTPLRGRGWGGTLALFGYAAPFSFAYLRIGAASGALILFGTVQVTMIGWGLAHGERPGARTWLGLLLAAAGLVALNLPRATRPDPLGAVLMALAGVAWASYSLQGKGVAEPLAANARSFMWSVPLALLLAALTLLVGHRSPGQPGPWEGRRLLLAGLSGAVTSGLGYAIWYRALRGLTAVRAAILQLSVPVIAAAAAVLLLGETVAPRLMFCGSMVLGGVALALSSRR
jgi:drug/metabolite transporter (DMT)-like permease